MIINMKRDIQGNNFQPNINFLKEKEGKKMRAL